jgi:hypothetical protein
MLKFDEIIFEEFTDSLKIIIYNFYYKEFQKDFLEREIGEYRVEKNRLFIENLDQSGTEKRFMRFFRKYKKDLTFIINNNRAIFVDEDFDLPLIGLQFMGILDKGSEIIEIKPLTNCNLDCSFCSVNEGISSNKEVDFVIDNDYLLTELKNLLKFKSEKNMEIWINPHGEPTLYAKLSDFCKEILEDKHVRGVRIITNGVLMGKKLIDELCGIKNKKNISLSWSISEVSKKACNKNSKLLMGENYNLGVVLSNLEYAIKKLDVVLTPVWLKNINDVDIKEIVLFAKKKGLKIQIQKFCKNKKGRNPLKEIKWENFFDDMRKLEKITNTNLLNELGKIKATKQLPLVCKKNDLINVKVVSSGRYKNDIIGSYETNNGKRAVQLINCHHKKNVKARVISNKYNIILAKC